MPIRALLCAYVASLPFASVELGHLPLAGKAVRPADVLFVVLVGTLLARRRWRRPEWTGIVVACLPVAALAVATAASAEPSAGVADLLRVSYSVAVLLVLGHARFEARERNAMWTAWTTTAAAVALLAVVGYAAASLGAPNPLAGPPSPQLASGAARAGGVLHPNTLAVYLHLGVVVALWRLANAGVARRGHRAGLGLMLVAAALTASRGLAGLAVSVALLAGRAEVALPRLWAARRTLRLAAGLLVAGAVTTTVVAVFPLSWSGGTPTRLGWNHRPAAYAVIHAAALRMAVAHPLAGVGPGRFGREFVAATTAAERDGAWPPAIPVPDLDPHSTWLGWGAEAGVPALTCWLGLHLWLLRRLGLARTAIPWDAGPCAAAALAGLMLSAAFVELSYLKFVWAFLGFAWADERGAASIPGPVIAVTAGRAFRA